MAQMRLLPGAILLSLAVTPNSAPADEPALPTTAEAASASGISSVNSSGTPVPTAAELGIPRLTAPRHRLLAAVLEQRAAAAEQNRQPAASIQISSLEVTGDLIESNEQNGTITVTGNPIVKRGQDELRCTRLVINRDAQIATAEGNVTIIQGDQQFTAARATYNFATRTGEAENVNGTVDQYILHAEKLILKPGPSYEAIGARFTPCEKEHPHQQSHARLLQITPGQELLARGLGIDLLGVRLATIPTLRKSLKPNSGNADSRSAYPSVGVDSRNGLFLEKQFDLRSRAPVWIDGFLRLNMLREPSAGLEFATPGSTQWVASLFYRDQAENQRGRFMQVSRLPQVGVVWANRRSVALPGRFLPHQVSNVRRPDYLKYSRQWFLAAELTAGYFQQYRGDDLRRDDGESKSGGRLMAQAQALLPNVQLVKGIGLNDLRIMARQSYYDSGQAHFVLGTGIGKEFRSGNWRVGIDRFDQFSSGTTPFLFDDIELRREWRPRLEFKSTNFNFSYYARLRPDRGGVFDQVFEVSKVFHCIEPRLRYGVRRQEIGLDIRLPGLTGNSRRRPSEPRIANDLDEPSVDAKATPKPPKNP